MNYSTEYAAQIAIILGFALKLFKINIASDDLTNIVSAVLVLGGAIFTAYKRWKHGADGVLPPVTALGVRKQ